MESEEQPGQGGTLKEVRLKPVNRQQMILRAVDVEKLIEPDHAARASGPLCFPTGGGRCDGGPISGCGQERARRPRSHGCDKI